MQVYGDYNKIVEELHAHFQATEDFPPSYIHIDASFCRLEISGQFKESVSAFLERKGF